MATSWKYFIWLTREQRFISREGSVNNTLPPMEFETKASAEAKANELGQPYKLRRGILVNGHYAKERRK